MEQPNLENKAKLYRKILSVMRDVEYLQKDDKVSFGQGSYKAISEEKVTISVRNAMIKHGIVILVVDQKHKLDRLEKKDKQGNQAYDNLTTVDVTYKICDVDTGESEIVVSSGTGVDTQDKGVGKAMTYAYKYMLLRNFAIPTGEDPDRIASDQSDDEQPKNEHQKNEQLKPAPQQPPQKEPEVITRLKLMYKKVDHIDQTDIKETCMAFEAGKITLDNVINLEKVLKQKYAA